MKILFELQISNNAIESFISIPYRFLGLTVLKYIRWPCFLFGLLMPNNIFYCFGYLYGHTNYYSIAIARNRRIFCPAKQYIYQFQLYPFQYILQNNLVRSYQDMTDVQYQPIHSQLEHKANGKCICEACNCGRHKCPDPLKKGDFHSSYNADYPKYDDFRPEGKYKMIQKNFILPEDKFYGQSAYTDDYNKKGATRPADKFVPKGQLTLSKEPFQANSSYINDYLNRGQGQRAQKMQLPKNFVMPEGKFDSNSNYTENYMGGKGQKPEQFRPVNQLKTGGAFEGVSSYLADYENRGVGAKAERVPLPRNQVMPEGRFQGSSNYTANYVPSKAEKLQQFKPEGQIKIGGNFQGYSSYGNDYSSKGMGQRAQRYPLPQNQVMPDGKFQGNSNYTDNYVPTKGERTKQIKPEGELKIGGDFKGQSSYLNDYANKGAGLKAQRVPLPRNQVMPEGKFQGDSVYHSNYVPSRIDRQPQFRPEGELKIGGNFQGSSSYGADYDNKGMGQRSQRIPLPRNQVMPQGRFQGNTAYTSDYLGSKMEKNPQFKPVGELKVGDGKFEGASSYSNDYLNKGSPIRAQRVPLPRNQILPDGKFDSNSTYTDNYVPTQIKKEHCLCDQLHAPRYQVTSKQHIRFNEKTHKWQ